MLNKTVEIIVYIEFILVAFIILLTYVIRIWYRIRLKVKNTLTKHITAYFAKLIPAAIPFDIEDFPDKWKKIEVITPILIRYRNLVDDQSWLTTKLKLVRTLMLPLARKAATSTRWELRFYAAMTFGIIYEMDDKQYIIRLMRDNVSLVKINAFSAAILLGTKDCIDFIISEISQQSFLTQTLYLTAFDNRPNLRPLIIKTLHETKNNNVRATCYNILIKYTPFKVDWDVRPDIHSGDLRLQLTAIRFISLADKEKAIPILLQMLHDDRWQIKAITIHFVSYLRIKEAIPNIVGFLNDDVELVKSLAAEAIENFGLEEKEIIRTQLIREDFATFDVSRYILNMT